MRTAEAVGIPSHATMERQGGVGFESITPNMHTQSHGHYPAVSLLACQWACREQENPVFTELFVFSSRLFVWLFACFLIIATADKRAMV